MRSHVEDLARVLRTKGLLQGEIYLRNLTPLEKAWHVALSGGNPLKARQRAIRHKMALAKEALSSFSSSSALLVHAHDPFTAQGVLEHGKFPLVMTIHGPAAREFLMDFGDRDLAEWVRNLEAQAYARAKRIIAVDEGQKKILVEEFSIPEEKIEVIANAVDPGALEEEAQGALSNPLVNLLAEESLRKRVILLPQSWRKTACTWPCGPFPSCQEYAFWVAGDGPMKEALHREVRALGLEERVRFLGAQPRSKVLALMRRAWAVLVPSIPVHGVVEATSMAALEAMALGAPVVASHLGGLAEIIRHGENGLLFPPGNPEALAVTLKRLEDPALRERLIAGGLRYVREEHSAERWGERVAACYAKAIQGV
ncbi:MAG: glycosyltransferase family 4 protein [Thermus sp.]